VSATALPFGAASEERGRLSFGDWEREVFSVMSTMSVSVTGNRTADATEPDSAARKIRNAYSAPVLCERQWPCQPGACSASLFLGAIC
jgi:hypothetical protein